MPVVMSTASSNNKKPRSQWKDRFIYTMLGLFAGMLGVHNFYLGRKTVAVLQVLMSVSWIVLMNQSTKVCNIAAFAIFCLEVVWVTLDVFLVAKEPDGDYMNDEARSIRILLIVVFWIAFILLPLGFTLLLKGPASLIEPLTEDGPPPEMSAR